MSTAYELPGYGGTDMSVRAVPTCISVFNTLRIRRFEIPTGGWRSVVVI